MPRNLDLTALRSFVAVADAGGVTRASSLLNLTQSAVSMQLKRLEEATGLSLIDRSSRTVALTGAGDQLLGYARRMLDLNDEVYARLTHQEFEGEIVLGVPHDIVYPAIPSVLHSFSADYPRVRVNLMSSYTRRLKGLFDRGQCDLILTTEDDCDAGGETLIEKPLIWIGAPGGGTWRQRPLRLAFEHNCIFRHGVQRALDAAGIPWEMAVESDSSRTVEASVSADLAVCALLEGTQVPHTERIQHGGALPELTSKKINLYVSDYVAGKPAAQLAALLRHAFKS
ncbi:LysR family transcriptional regulator [Roseitranquillus sediminis]|uniref:LysR family transcriptional regulator n=1 Tax=Roseitranquillus sediminis TaxID=2809051 RepID=UPI001D0C42FC|nr:LysR family transcriptional regulator [Roseitranquillus sediminis]MBM9595324.1 LysR family transcriptional regulator [Roseitranquillus sediminis]